MEQIEKVTDRQKMIYIIANRVKSEHGKHAKQLPDEWAFIAAQKIMREMEEVYAPNGLSYLEALAALKKIAAPITFLEEEAYKSGKQLDGLATIKLANDVNWIKSIAETALNKTKTH